MALWTEPGRARLRQHLERAVFSGGPIFHSGTNLGKTLGTHLSASPHRCELISQPRTVPVCSACDRVPQEPGSPPMACALAGAPAAPPAPPHPPAGAAWGLGAAAGQGTGQGSPAPSEGPTRTDFQAQTSGWPQPLRGQLGLLPSQYV